MLYSVNSMWGLLIMNKTKEIYEVALKWTKQAGTMLKNTLQNPLHVEYKTSAADLVTEKDREIEQFFVQKINATYPNHFILGEEGSASEQAKYDPMKETVWIIDPIDGTTNFVHQKRNFAISVGIYEKGQPVIGIIYDPISDECFHAQRGEGAYLNEQQLPSITGGNLEESLVAMNSLWLTPNNHLDHERLQAMVNEVRGVRCQGSAALELAYVACGRLDASIAIGLGPWDFGGGYVLLNEVGASITTVDNQPIDPFHPSSVFVAKPEIHPIILENYLFRR